MPNEPRAPFTLASASGAPVGAISLGPDASCNMHTVVLSDEPGAAYDLVVPVASDSEVSILQRCGHMPMYEDPDGFVTTVSAFLSR